MSDQLQLRNRSEMAINARQQKGLDRTPDQRQRPGDEWIERIADQITQTLEDRLAHQNQRIESEEARKIERDRLIRQLRARLLERRMYATWLESEIEAREQRISNLFETANQTAESLRRAEAELGALREHPVRFALSQGRQRIGRTVRAIRRRVKTPGALSQTLRQRLGLIASQEEVVAIWDRPELQATTEVAASAEQDRPESTRDRNEILRWIPPRRDPYECFLQNQAVNAEELLDEIAELKRRPTFSVFVTQNHDNARQFRETIASLRRQIYPNRVVVLSGGSGSTVGTVDGRETHVHEDQEPLELLQAAANSASSDYLVFVNHGAILHEDMLFEFARTISNAAEPPDLIFGDEDRIDANGVRFDPRFRSSWSPELMLAYQAIGATFAVRRSTFETVGGLRPEFGQAWPYDVVLRLAEHSDRMVRVPNVLVSVPAERGANDPVDCCSVETIRQSARALAEAIGRRAIEAQVSQPPWASRFRVPVFELNFPDRGPRVSILIPTRDRVDLLRRCVESIRERTTYQDYDIVVIDNGSQEAETVEYLGQLGPGCRVIRIENDERGFSYARIHNQAIQQLEDSVEFVVLLNNDTEVVRSEWLSQLVGYGQLDGVGVVGGRLLYPDGRLQHAGIVTDLFEGGPGHLFKGLPWWHTDLQFLDRVVRNVSAVTAACLLVRKDTYLKIGGFDEDAFAIGFNDVDFCLRLSEAGLRCVYAPRAELLHYEGASRGHTLDLLEQQRFLERWGDRSDPYYHPALVRNDHRPGMSTRYHGVPKPLRKHPVRVLIDLDRLDGRGSSRFVKNLMEGYRQQGNIVPEVCCRSDGGMASVLRTAGYPVSVVPIDGSQTLSDHIQVLADDFDRNEYDLIHAVGLGQFSTLLAARLARIPSLWSIREAVDFRDAFLTLDHDAARAAIEAFSVAYRVIFPAQHVRNLFTPVETCWNFEVIHEAGLGRHEFPERNEARARLGLSRSTTLLTCLHDGDVHEIDHLLDQCAALVRSGEELIVQMLGTPELGQGLVRNAFFRHLGHRVQFDSIFDEAHQKDALAASDVLVNASRSDLNPEVVSTALELRTPLIQSEVLGIDEYVCPDPAVLRFDPCDPEMLRSRLESILKTPPDDRARSRMIVRYRFEDMVMQYERLTLEAIRVFGRQSHLPSRETIGVA